jgi:hypothetical protein
LTGSAVFDRESFEVWGNFLGGVMEKVKNFLKNRLFQKSFVVHLEALLMSFPIIETIFLYYEFSLEIDPNMSVKGDM